MVEERSRTTSHDVVTGSHGDGEAMTASKAEKQAGKEVWKCGRTSRCSLGGQTRPCRRESKNEA